MKKLSEKVLKIKILKKNLSLFGNSIAEGYLSFSFQKLSVYFGMSKNWGILIEIAGNHAGNLSKNPETALFNTWKIYNKIGEVLNVRTKVSTRQISRRMIRSTCLST